MTFIKITEQPSLYDNLEQKSVTEILTEINKEDQKVAMAVEKTISEIEKLVTSVVERMKRGGRLFYIGAGTSGRLGVLDAAEIPPPLECPTPMLLVF
jgi:N-acetylmuramic acid 6-phosphate etherase